MDVKGVAVMGGFDHSASGNGVQGAPHVTVKGFSLWGGVNVKRKRRKRRESLEER
ncbi:protein of uncharacterised function (DUF1707) [Mycobacteroides abscessus subsp. abscessus]|nr:protein of uncharacterised function (DUF1707) [Mycobacteroides abscessus subsp. abscessus]